MGKFDLVRLTFEKLSNKNKVSDFCCGQEKIDDFINREAIEFQEERLGITYLVYTESNLVGFITISMAHVKTQKMNLNDRLKIPIENYPALQIGQLGIKKELQGEGLGRRLIEWSMYKALQYSKSIGIRLLVLNSIPSSVNFYKRCKFVELEGQKNRRELVMYHIIPKEVFKTLT